jgi:transposase
VYVSDAVESLPAAVDDVQGTFGRSLRRNVPSVERDPLPVARPDGVPVVYSGREPGQVAAAEIEAIQAMSGLRACCAQQDRTRDRPGACPAGELKDARFALWKNPENLTARQETKLARIEQTNRPIFRAYLLKEQLRQIYRLPAVEAAQLLERWLIWARRCRLRPFVKLAKTITQQKAGILAAITNGLSNARVEAINTQIRPITRRAFGFHTPEALIALAMLSLAGLCPPLPAR